MADMQSLHEFHAFVQACGRHLSGSTTRHARSTESHAPGECWLLRVPAWPTAGFDNATVKLIEADPEPVPGYASEKEGWRGRSFKQYASAIDTEPGQFDLIVVDGRARAACLAHAIRKLAPNGMILFDNSGRERYRRAIKESGMQARTCRGATACLPYPDETTLLRPAAVSS